MLKDAFQDFGGYILVHNHRVMSTVIVEIDYDRKFDKGSTDNHISAIIDYHSPFDRHIGVLWAKMRQDLTNRSSMTKHRFVYYQTASSVLALKGQLRAHRRSFLKKHKFDEHDALQFALPVLV